MKDSPPLTTQNRKSWRIWHWLTYQLAAISFFIGSLLAIPSLKIEMVAAWFIVFGAAAFIIATTTEWLHYTVHCCPYHLQSINYSLNVISNIFYQAGSIELMPQINNSHRGYLFFFIGGGLLVVSQSWKLLRMLTPHDLTLSQAYRQDVKGFYLDLFAGVAGVMSLIGTFLARMKADRPSYLTAAIVCYCVGSMCFVFSGIFMERRYFGKRKINQKPEVSKSEVKL